MSNGLKTLSLVESTISEPPTMTTIKPFDLIVGRSFNCTVNHSIGAPMHCHKFRKNNPLALHASTCNIFTRLRYDTSPTCHIEPFRLSHNHVSTSRHATLAFSFHIIIHVIIVNRWLQSCRSLWPFAVVYWPPPLIVDQPFDHQFSSTLSYSIVHIGSYFRVCFRIWSFQVINFGSSLIPYEYNLSEIGQLAHMPQHVACRCLSSHQCSHSLALVASIWSHV